MSFCTAINCMDGRVQLPVIDYLRERFGVLHVDVVTAPGPVSILSVPEDSEMREDILKEVELSINAHQSKGIAIVAHHDCAGNPQSEKRQLEQLRIAFEFLLENYPDMDVIGLWLNEDWIVSEVYKR